MDIFDIYHFHIFNDTTMQNFMDTIFNGTKVQWLLNLINLLLDPMKADIWRYSILWIYGGVYMDTDADKRSPLHKVKYFFKQL